MSEDTVPSLIEKLRSSRVLEARQLSELTEALQESFLEAEALAQELRQRGWLTDYQISRLREGTGTDLVLGDYLLLDLLGEGGMGQVFKARHRVMNRIVALKVIRKDRLAGDSSVNRFYQEIRSAAQLTHPNVVLAYDARAEGNTHFFVMEFVEGSDLARLVKDKGPPAAELACDYIRQAALGLQHAHERGLIHRDIKPSNLLLTRDGVVKLLDMGLARLNLEIGDEHTPLTRDGAIMGTPDFMSPEQALDSRTVDIRSDIYSLGCSLYYLLAGQSPVPGGNMLDKLYRHRFEEIEPVERVGVEIPPGVALVVQKMMAKKREDRYQTPAEVAAALAPFCVLAGGGARPRSATVIFQNASGQTAPTNTSSLGTIEQKRPARPAAAGTDTQNDSATIGGEPASATTPMSLPQTARTGRGGLLLKTGAAVVVGLGIAFAAMWYVRHDSQPTPPAPTNPAVTTPPGSGSGEPAVVRTPGVPAAPEPARLPGDWWESVAFLSGGSAGGSVGNLPWRVALIPEVREALRKAPALEPVVELPRGLRELFASLSFCPPSGFPAAPPWTALALSTREKGMPLYGLPNPEPEPGLLYRLNGHQRGVTSVVFSPNGKRALSGGKDANLRLWDLENDGKELRRFGVEASDLYPLLIWSVDFSSNGPYAVSGSGGFFDLDRPEEVRAGRYADGRFHVVSLWRVETWEEIRLGSLDKMVRAVAISTDGKWVLSGGDDRQLRLWDVAEKRQAQIFQPDGLALQAVQSLALSRDGKHAVSADNNCVRLWDMNTGKERNRLEWRDADNPVKITSVTFLPDGQRVVFGTRENNTNLVVWDTNKKNEALALPGHRGATVCVAVSGDGRRVLTGGRDGEVSLWDLSTKERICSFTNPGHPGEVAAVAISPDGRRAVSGSADGSMVVWVLPR